MLKGVYDLTLRTPYLLETSNSNLTVYIELHPKDERNEATKIILSRSYRQFDLNSTIMIKGV